MKNFKDQIKEQIDELPEINISKNQRELENILLVTSELLEREFPREYGAVDSAQVLFLLRYRISFNVYNALNHILAEKPADPFRLKTFVFTAPPLVRTLFEDLITVIFLLEDPTAYVPYLFRTDYGEKKRELTFVLQYQPEKTKYIKDLQKVIGEMETRFSITEKEKTSKNFKYPSTGNLLSKLESEHSKANVLPFLKFIKNYIYRYLSNQSHMDIGGLLIRGHHFDKKLSKKLFGDNPTFYTRKMIDLYRSEQIVIYSTLMLSIVSEMNHRFKFPQNYHLTDKLWRVWNAFLPTGDVTKEFWNRRYKNLIN